MSQPSSGADFTNPADATIRDILATPRAIAVVGCSPDPRRDSHQIAALLKARGHTIIPVNPHCQEVLGEPCFPSLREVPTHIEMVDVFRRSQFVGQIAEEAITIGASILWLQLGVIDPVAAQRAQMAGLTVVMNRCPAIEYRRLF